MTAPAQPRAPRFLAHPKSFFYQPVTNLSVMSGSSTVTSYLTTNSIGKIPWGTDPSLWDQTTYESGPHLENVDTLINWTVISDSDTFMSTHRVTGSAGFWPKGLVLGLAVLRNQASNYLGVGNYGDTHSYAWSRKHGITADGYLIRDQNFDGYLEAANSITMYSFRDLRFPTKAKHSDDTWGNQSGKRLGSCAANIPYAPLLATYDWGLTGEYPAMLSLVIPSDKMNATEFLWPSTQSDGSGGSSPVKYGMVFRLKANYAIPSSLSEPAKAVLRTLKKRGAVVMDVGGPGQAGFGFAYDPRWNHSEMVSLFDDLAWSDFDVLDISSLSVSADSMEITN